MKAWRLMFPLLWPVVLLFTSPLGQEMLARHSQHREVERLLHARRLRLEGLRAQAVAGRLEQREYERLVQDLAVLTGLKASDPFRDPEAPVLSSIQVAALFDALGRRVRARSEGPAPDATADLEFLPVTLGRQQGLGPFVMVEFILRFRGRFRSVAPLLHLVTELGRERRLVISLGELRLTPGEETEQTGAGLLITLPVRAYFRE